MNFDNLTSFMKHLTNEVDVPSVDIIVCKDGKQVYRHSGGRAYSEDYKYYNLYSVSKVITCTAALQLLEKGKYLLNDPLYEYMPEFKEMYVKKEFVSSDEGRLRSEGREVAENGKKFEIVKAKKPICIKNLFSMSAGFDYDMHSPEAEKLNKETNGRFPTRMIAKALSQRPLSFEPGEHWQYSLCHDVLGAFTEVVSGMRFSEYLKKNIFEPLGMNDTTMKVTDEVLSKMFPQFEYDSETKKAHEISKDNGFIIGSEYEGGGAGIISTVDDYIKFATALANGGKTKDGVQILSPHTINLMRTNRLGEKQLADFNWNQLSGYGYGLGVRTMIDRAKGGSLSPIGEFGWGGAAGAYAMIDPDNHISVFYGQHMLNNLEPYIHPRIRNIVYSSLTK